MAITQTDKKPIRNKCFWLRLSVFMHFNVTKRRVTAKKQEEH
ncbi:unnamed protein product, partial [marine sediment metagenome]